MILEQHLFFVLHPRLVRKYRRTISTPVLGSICHRRIIPELRAPVIVSLLSGYLARPIPRLPSYHVLSVIVGRELSLADRSAPIFMSRLRNGTAGFFIAGGLVRVILMEETFSARLA